MPFDGTEIAESLQLERPRLRVTRIRLEPFVYFFLLASIVAVFFSEIVWPGPGAGVLTRLIDGNAVANENWIVREILESEDIHRLRFSVGGHEYQVVTPGHVLADEQKAAWFSFAGRHNYPMYSVDGALAMDP